MDHGSWPEGRHADGVAGRGRRVADYAARPAGACRPRINKGTAFGDSERRDLGLTGLIPAAHFTLEDQVARVYAQYRRQPDDLARNITLNALHDRDEVPFYRLLAGHLSEMLPIIYTPTVGQAIEHYSHEYRRPRGIYLTARFRPRSSAGSLGGNQLGPARRNLPRGRGRTGWTCTRICGQLIKDLRHDRGRCQEG
jgi:Malic enzyme, N-terminal domain